MFLILKMVIIFTFFDYIIYNYYSKNYNIIYINDSYKYRIIISTIYWLFLTFSLTYNLLPLELSQYILYSSIISFIIYFSMNIYNKKINTSYSIQFMCVDIFYGIVLTNILILITYFLK